MKSSNVPGAVVWRIVFQYPEILWPLINFTALEIEKPEARLSLRIFPKVSWYLHLVINLWWYKKHFVRTSYLVEVLREQILSLVTGLEKQVRGWISPQVWKAWREQLPYPSIYATSFNPLLLGNIGDVAVSLAPKARFTVITCHSASMFVPRVQGVPKSIFTAASPPPPSTYTV